MITTGKILKFDKHGNKLLLELPENVERELIQKHIGSVELRLNDGRRISADQRRKIFAIVRDIALWSGHEPEFIRAYMTWDYIKRHDGEWFSLSDVDMTTAKDFITHLKDSRCASCFAYLSLTSWWYQFFRSYIGQYCNCSLVSLGKPL